MPDLTPAPDSSHRSVHLDPHVVPWRNAFAWYEEAMRLFKFAPLTFVGLAFVTIATELLLKMAPGALTLSGELIAPLVACGLLYAAAAADRREPPSLRFAMLVFRSRAGVIAAIVGASLVTFAAQALAGWWIADANLLVPENAAQLSVPAVFGVYAIGTLASLPVTFVPLIALFDRATLREAFVASGLGFAQNTVPLLVYGAASLALLAFGLLTAGFGLVLALPLWAASSYAAWKDIFGVREGPTF